MKIWHWAHVAGVDCDPWAEHESAWHSGWKSLFPQDRTEVVIGPHRADVVTLSGSVIELQHSAISCFDIAERERFYRNLLWIFDVTEIADHFSVIDRDEYTSFRWRWARKTWASAKRPVVLDFGAGRLLRVKKFYDSGNGWGTWLSVEKLLSWAGGMTSLERAA